MHESRRSIGNVVIDLESDEEVTKAPRPTGDAIEDFSPRSIAGQSASQSSSIDAEREGQKDRHLFMFPFRARHACASGSTNNPKLHPSMQTESTGSVEDVRAPDAAPCTPLPSKPSEQSTPRKTQHPLDLERLRGAGLPPAKRQCSQLCEKSAPQISTRQAAFRPALTEISAETPLTVFVVAIDERFAQPPPGFAMIGSTPGQPAPSISLQGSTRDGHSVLLHVHGALPYFYAEKPPAPLESCRQALEGTRTTGGSFGPVVANLEEVDKLPLMGFHAEKQHFVRITVTGQKHVAPCRAALEKGLRLPREGLLWKSPAFESNVPYIMRFLVDTDAGGGAWVEVPGGCYQFRGRQSRISSAQIEVDAHVRSLKIHRSEGEWLGVAPLRLLTLHVRTAGPEEQLVALAAALQVQGESLTRHQVVWVVNARCTNGQELVAGAEVCQCSDERELLEGLQEYIHQVDADVLIGHDLLNVHLSAILTRAEAVGMRNFRMGRLLGVPTRAKNTTFETRQLGKHETKDINVDGRLLFDILTVLEREQKLSSYSLSALALRFLKESRLELGSAAVKRLAKEDPLRLGKLALQDALICMRIFNAQHLLFRYVEMARVTGVPMEFLLTRGQSVKVFSMLLRKARARDYVLPPPMRGGPSEESYEGGAVLEPIAGFYDEPIVTLDFASLYPSIMQRHNLCYSTLLPAKTFADGGVGGGVDFEAVPGLGHRFVTNKVRKGLLPMVLEELLAARADAKKAMKAAADPQLRAVLDGRQLALKVSANSVYGFTGMSVGMLPCQAIAASVTAYGRQMIERTRQVVETTFCRARGFEVDAKVIYGDTDSVMVSLGSHLPLADVFRFGHEAAGVVSKEFGAPVKMEFEKIYSPFLLMSKKRYAGLSWNRPEEAGKLDAKGIEVVRRDWCELVRRMVDRCLHLLMEERSVEKAVAYVQETITTLRQGRTDPRLLVISKALVREGADAYAAKQAHVELAEKLRQRNPGAAPQIGDRIPYVFIVAAAKQPAYERAEDPRYALEHELPIDAEYYIEHQLKAPLLRIFEPILGKESGKNIEQLLFAGDHARKIAMSAQAGPLTKFVRKRAKCLGCRSLLPPALETGALCAACAEPDKAAGVVFAQLASCRPLEAEASRLLAQCACCEGSLCGKLHLECANVDCPIFFRRFQVNRELEAVQTALQKLQIDW